MHYLPTLEEQTWLIEQVSAFIRTSGPDRFLNWPIVEPTPRFFPDPWSFSHRGLDRLVRRLMQYASMEHLDLEIVTYLETDHLSTSPGPHRSTAGFFVEIKDSKCIFGFNEESPSDAEYMAGVMAHEVAHAYRTYHHLVSSSVTSEEEECITDVTTACLGFGILAANNSFRYRTEGWNVGGWTYHSWSARQTGYLPPQAFAYLLALQIVARDLPSTEGRQLVSQLETDQAAFAKSALDEIAGRRDEMMQALNLASTPELNQKAPEEILKPLPQYIAPSSAAPAALQPINLGRPVFKVLKTYSVHFALIGGSIGLVLGAGLAVLFGKPLMGPIGTVSGLAIGGIFGSRRRYSVCSEPQCGVRLSTAENCPNCGGTVAGLIRRPSDRLEATENWEREHRRNRPPFG